MSAPDPRASGPMPGKAPHLPVLLEEVVAALNPQGGDLIVDATLGASTVSPRYAARTASASSLGDASFNR